MLTDVVWSGTWTRTSTIIRARNPFATDSELFQYDYDSEGDWNEEEEGTDIVSGGEQSDDEEELSDGDSDNWLVGDNEAVEFVDGHIDDSDEEPDVMFDGESVEDARIRIREEKLKAARELHRSRGVGHASGVPVVVIKGPAWEKRIGRVTSTAFEGMRIRFLHGWSSVSMLSSCISDECRF